MRTFSNLMQLLEKSQRRTFVLFALMCLISPALDLFGVSRIIPVIQQAFQSETSGLMAAQVIFLAIILLLVGVFELLKNRCSTILVMDIAHTWSLKIYALYEEEELEEHNRKNIAQAISSVRTDPVVCAGMIPFYVELIVDSVTAAAYSAMMIYTARGVGVISCLLTVVFMTIFYLSGQIYAVHYGEKRRRLEIKAAGLVSTAFGSYKEIKVDARKKKLLEKYCVASEGCAQMQKNYAFMKGMQGVVLRDFMQATLFLLLAVILVLGVNPVRILPGAMIYITLLIRMLPISQRIAAELTSLQYASEYYEALKETLDRYENLQRMEADRRLLREKQITLKQGIYVENLSFHYPNGKQIFENASVYIPAGHSVAIVGPSGEGKTTLLDLILGLLKPQSGHIWYDDFDIVEGRDSQGSCWANIGNVISYIPQTVYLNDDTIRSNVAFMVDEDEEKLIECLKYAQVWEDVRDMPEGLDTLIGRNGTAISGGQRQRIALARALYKQFEILIMDEATAALDVDTECAVIDSIRKIRRDKTVLLVTHHPNLANECEYVYRLENRQIVKIR